MDELLNANLELLRVSADKRADLELAIRRPVWIRADALRQVIVNLVANASDSLEGNAGTISIEVGQAVFDQEQLEGFVGTELPEGEYASLKVTDTGVGMTPDAVGRVFDPFYTTKFTSRGLGMAVVMGMVRSHGGGIHIESMPGRGTSVEVLLPPDVEPAKEVRKSAVARAAEVDGRVLVVDDERRVRELIIGMLDHFEIVGDGAENGRQAIAVLARRREEFGLVILDVTMPEVDGISVAYELIRTYPDLPIVLSSGYSAEAIPDDLREEVVFLKKPFTLDSMSAALAAASERSISGF